MAEILIYWPEIEDGDFPDCCMTCGCEDTELVPRRLETYHHRVLWSYRRFVIVDLPFCQAHRSRPWVRWGRTDAWSFTQEGIWVKNVSPIFVEEMEYFREEEDEYEERRRRKKHKKRRKRTAKDRDDDNRGEPFSQPHVPPQPAGGMVVPFVILAVVVVPILLVGACCVGTLFLPGVKFGAQPDAPGPQGPGFNNRPGPVPGGGGRPVGPVGPGRRP
jgi:hypothetical protein